MSVEEEVELRELITQTLESNGCLSKIRAQLRASIFLAVDEDSEISCRKPLLNNKIKQHLETAEGKMMFCIVHEFLEFFDLFSTMSVYETEIFQSGYQYNGRQKLMEDVGLSADNTAVPVLLHLIRIAQLQLNGVNLNIDNFNYKSPDANGSSEIEEKDDPLEISNEQNVMLNVTYGVTTPKALNTSSTDLNNSVDRSSLNVNGTSYSKLKEKDSEENSSISCSSAKQPDISVNCNNHEKPSQKSDKIKTKGNLGSLSDLPPLQINRSRDVLPSLYSKEFKDKSNLRELDKLFDVETEYEDDFVCNGNELSLKSECSQIESRIGIVKQNDLSSSSKTETKQSKSSSKLLSGIPLPRDVIKVPSVKSDTDTSISEHISDTSNK